MEHSTINPSVYQPAVVADPAAASSAGRVSHPQSDQLKPTVTLRRVSLRNLALELNSQATTPLHDQLFFLLKKALDDGELEDVSEGRLPSLRNMSSLLGLSRETVSKAISKLVGYGYLSTHERKRIYVIPRKVSASENGGPQGCRAETYLSVNTNSEFGDGAQEQQLDFRPPANDAVPQVGYGKNYLTDKYLKTLRRQSTKRSRFELDPCGLASFREVLCEQLNREADLDFQAENLILFSDFRSATDFVVRLTARGRSTCVVEAPGSSEIRSIIDANSLPVVEIPVDEEGMRADILSSYGLAEAVCVVSPSMQDPLGVRLSPQRVDNLMDWARTSNSIVFEHSPSHGFLRIGATPLLWQPASGVDCVYAWTFASALKPWAQTCCVVFSSGLIKEARQLKSTIGGEVSINEQIALQDFILDGDLLRAQRQRELVNLEKRRRLSLAFPRICNGAVSVWRGNCGAKLVLEVDLDANPALIVETARSCGLPVRIMDELLSSEQHPLDRRLVLDLDLINVDAISSKLETMESMLAARDAGRML